MKQLENTKAYKAFNNDWTCKCFKYEVGKTYEMDEKPIICAQGFHACYELQDCLKYYALNKDTRFAEVEILGYIDTERDADDSKVCTNKIKIVREIPFEEVLKLTKDENGNNGYNNKGYHNIGNNNIGNYNEGYYNEGNTNNGRRNNGNYNAGNYNSGNYNGGNNNDGNNNKGDRNNGNCNIGNNNEGHNNKGDFNKGNDNQGNFNVGLLNIGHCNKGRKNYGCFNIGNNIHGMFNKEINQTDNDILYAFNKEIDIKLFNKLRHKIKCFDTQSVHFLQENADFIEYAKSINYFDIKIFTEITKYAI